MRIQRPATPVTFGLFVHLFFISPISASGTFETLKITPSAGRAAICTSGTVKVDIQANNTRFDLAPLADQFVVTNIIQQLFEVNSTFVEDTSKGIEVITTTLNISAQLCYPSDGKNSSSSMETVQVLSHGLGLDKSYWDIAPGYSYVDAAAKAGYATFAFDRLGVGSSDHPDPTAVVQSSVHVEVLHALIEGLKNGSIGEQRFKNVVGVGHSYGSVIQLGHDVKYPNDCNAVILTGIGNDFGYVPYALLSNNPTLANTVRGEYVDLNNGYLLTPTPVAFQEPFFRFPYFDQAGM